MLVMLLANGMCKGAVMLLTNGLGIKEIIHKVVELLVNGSGNVVVMKVAPRLFTDGIAMV